MIRHAPHFHEFYVDFYTIPKTSANFLVEKAMLSKFFSILDSSSYCPQGLGNLHEGRSSRHQGLSPIHTWLNGCRWQSSQVLFSSLESVMWESEDTIMIAAQTKMRGAND
jgi:hypothetical protein